MKANRKIFFLLLLLLSLIFLDGMRKPLAILSIEEQTPILFLHGYGGSKANWDSMINRFKADGWTSSSLFAYDFTDTGNCTESANVENAHQIKNWVSNILIETGANKIDLVAHSMGGLSSRYFVKFLAEVNSIDDFVSLGSPHHGRIPLVPAQVPCCYSTNTSSTFVNKLNEGDETPHGILSDTIGERIDNIMGVTYNGSHVPGNISYTCIYSRDDEVVTPFNTSRLDGAINIALDGLSHVDLVLSHPGYIQVRNAVDDLNRTFTTATTGITDTSKIAESTEIPFLFISLGMLLPALILRKRPKKALLP